MASLKDLTPPNNIAAERAALGALLLNWDAVGNIISFLRPENFYSLQNQKIFTAILSLYNKSIRGDIITLIEELRSKGELEASGGEAYIAELTSEVPTSENIEYYAKKVLDSSLRREMIHIAQKIISDSHDDSIESETTLEKSQNQLMNLADGNIASEYKKIEKLVSPALDAIIDIRKNNGSYTGIPSGFEELDQMTSGFQKSEFIVIGARPSIGKTALALSMAQYISVTKNIPVGFMSLEMSDMQLMMRLLSMESNINATLIRTGRLSMSDLEKLNNAAGRIYTAPLYIVDTPNMKLLDLRSMARKLKLQENIQILFIDYIGLIQSENTSIPRFEQVAEISRSLKSLARELQIPVVVLSQVRRDTEGKAPGLADLRESGAIEQDADVVMFLHRDRATTQDLEKTKDSAIPTELNLAKQRNGPIGNTEILYKASYTKFVNKDKSDR
jgi:replicative DNA helicase